jgi:hypothetical protein
MFSLGVDCVNPESVLGERVVRTYGNDAGWYARWADARLHALTEMGFNTLGAWHDPVFWTDATPKTVEIRISRNAPRVNRVWGHGFPDVFSPGFRDSAWREVYSFLRNGGQELTANGALIGLFCDNEAHWWGSRGEWGDNDQAREPDCLELVDDYIRLPPEAPGKQRWIDHLRTRYRSIGALNTAWESAYGSFDELAPLFLYRARPEPYDEDRRSFLRLIAEEYFAVADDVYQTIAPDALRLGCRFVGTSTPKTVLEVARDHMDVVSVNFYRMTLPSEYLTLVHDITERPVMITEFAFSEGRSAGFWKSTNGAQKVLVASQQARAEAYRAWIEESLRLPFLVGNHWFALYDYGNPDGLIGNYGLFTLEDEPYTELQTAMTQTNRDFLERWEGSFA